MSSWRFHSWKLLALTGLIGLTSLLAQGQTQLKARPKPQQTLIVAAYPAVDEIVKSNIPLMEAFAP